jgi:CheY-like chemotaxis protein
MPPTATTILVIDDDESVGVILRRALKSYDVALALSAEEGLDRVSTQAFDGILCDLTLPGDSGAIFLQKVAAIRPGQELRVRFMTGGATDEDTLALVANRPDAVIHKPFEIEHLRRFVADLVA